MRHPTALSAALLATFAAGVAVGRRVPAAAPAAAPAPAARTYELRTYVTPPGRLPLLERRFREHTMAIFARHGMVNVGYWTPQDSAAAAGGGTTLVYLLAHASRDAAAQSWRAFGADPEWQRVRAASEADGPIVSRVESVFLTPTDYSPMR